MPRHHCEGTRATRRNGSQLDSPTNRRAVACVMRAPIQTSSVIEHFHPVGELQGAIN